MHTINPLKIVLIVRSYFKYLWVVSFVVFSSCSKGTKEEDSPLTGVEDIPEEDENTTSEHGDTIDWDEAADFAQQSLKYFYDAPSKSYTATNTSKNWTQYWPTAHTLDVLVDGYLRTKDEDYLGKMNDLLIGMKARNGNHWPNFFYDDMEWMALATLRAFEATGDSQFKEINDILWNDIKGGWTEDLGGGIWWNKDQGGKNAVSNGPASIIASRRYRLFGNEEDLDWALKLYDWERSTLFSVTGSVWDNINKNGEINKNWIFSYNQGTFAGAAIELYLLTDEDTYLQESIAAADYALSPLTNLTKNGILKDLGGGDGGLFNGIFVRYLTYLIESEALPKGKKQAYVRFLKENAQSLWENGTNKDFPLFAPNWESGPAPSEVDLTVQLSGIMLLEAAAKLNSQGLF